MVMICQPPNEHMIEIAQQIKQDPQEVDRSWSKGHDWDSALISTTIERIEDASKTMLNKQNKLRLAAYLLTQRSQDIWDSPESWRDILEASKEKEDVEMNPCDLCPSMFEQWYQQDGKKITASTNNINAMKEVFMTFLFKLYTSEDELNAANVVECLRLQSTDTLKHWYDNPGMLHRQLHEA